jgi:DNA segregation ATPase FtsK/SpoIIIE, S-DNA-T family
VVAMQTRPVAEPAMTPSSAARRAANRAAPAPAHGSGWFQLAVLSATAGGVAAGIASLAGQPQWQPPLLGLGLCLAAIAASTGVRIRSRRRQELATAERIAPLLGLSGLSTERLRRLVRARWPLGARRDEPPCRITVCPPTSYALSDPARLERIAYTAGRVFRVRLRVGTVHRRRHELVLVPARLEEDAEVPAGPDPSPREIRCAEVVVGQRLGGDAEIAATEFGSDEHGTPRLESIDLRFTPTADNTEPSFWVDFEAAFNRQVPGRWRARPDLVVDAETTRARCRIQRRPTLSTRIPYDLDRLDRCGEHEIPYAVDESGRTVAWSLRLSPHLLVSGATRSGKSSTLRAVVRGFVARGWPVTVCDPKRTGLLGMRGWPGVQALATPTNPPHMVAVIEHVHAAMNRRCAAIEAGLTRKARLEPLLLVLDEYRELRDEIRLWWAREGAVAAERRRVSEPPAFELLEAIARQGGEVGIHLAIGITRPDIDAKVLPAELRDNCRCRCSLGSLTRDEAQAMWGNLDTGRSVPPMIQGRGTAVRADGSPGEIQSLWLPDPLGLDGDDVDLYRRIRPTDSPHPWLKYADGRLVETDAAPDTPWAERGRHVRTDVDDTAADPLWGPIEADVSDWELRYSKEDLVLAREVSEADIVEVDRGSNVWVVVDQVATDPDEPDMLYIDGRVVDTGHPKTIVADEDAMLSRRRQVGD